MSHRKSGKKMRTTYIDVLRGVAILGVLFHHFFFDRIAGFSTYNETSIFGITPFLINNGWLGVNLFFILSGMVLYRPSIILSINSVVNYYRLRCLRIWPLYFLFIFFITIIGNQGLTKFGIYTVLLLSGIHDLIPSYWMPENVCWVFWSLGVEILFSAILPALLFAAGRLGFWNVFTAILILTFLYRSVADHVWFELYPDYTNNFINPFKDNIFGRLDDFFIGMAAAKLSNDNFKVRKTLIIPSITGLLFVANSWNYMNYAQHTVYNSIFASMLHIIFSMSILGVILTIKNLTTWQSPYWLPLSYAGTTCYSAYITHAILIVHADELMSGRWYFAPLKFGVFVLVTFIIAGFLFVFVEASGIKHLPRWTLRVLGRNGEITSPSGIVPTPHDSVKAARETGKLSLRTAIFARASAPRRPQ